MSRTVQPKPKQTKPKWFYLVSGGRLYQEQVHAGTAYQWLGFSLLWFLCEPHHCQGHCRQVENHSFLKLKLATLEEFILIAWVLLCVKMLLNIRLSQFQNQTSTSKKTSCRQNGEELAKSLNSISASSFSVHISLEVHLEN